MSIHFDHCFTLLIDPYLLSIDQLSHHDINPILPLVPLQSILSHHSLLYLTVSIVPTLHHNYDFQCHYPSIQHHYPYIRPQSTLISVSSFL